MNDNQDPDELGDENEETGDDALPTEKFPEGEAPEAAPEEAPDLDQSLGGTEQGQTGGEGAQDSGSATVPEAAASDPSLLPIPAPTESESASADTEADKAEKKDATQEDDEINNADDSNDDPALTAPSDAADGQTKQRASTSDPRSDPAQSRQQQQPTPAEPQRSLGDALQSWKRRLEALSDLKEADPDKPEDEALAAGDEEGEVEFVQDGDEQDQDAQALGPASEEQVQGLEGLKLSEDDNQQSFEPDAMETDDNQQPIVPATSTLDLDSATLQENEAKAIAAHELKDNLNRAEQDTAMDETMDEIIRDEDDDLSSATLALPLLDPELDAQVEETMLLWRSGDDDSLTADGVWRLYESLTRDLSYALTEQLRLILEPTLATRLKGDYRSGKRLNMKKIIPYIASEFTKDLIWKRRSLASQREYQIIISIDDSKSMADSHSINLAYKTLALITKSLARLEAGGISVCKFGDSTEVLHSFESGAISDEAGAALISKFSFAQRTTNVRLLIEKTLEVLTKAKESSKVSSAGSDLWQLSIILSDGVMQDQDKIKALLRKATEQKVMIVFIIIDSLHSRTTADSVTPEVNRNSIVEMQSVNYTKGVNGQLELKMTRYLDTFPFDHFVVLRDVAALPDTLSQILREFFSSVSVSSLLHKRVALIVP